MVGIVCCDIAGHGLGLQGAVGKIFVFCYIAAISDLNQAACFVVDSCGSPPVDCGALADEAGGEACSDINALSMYFEAIKNGSFVLL